MPKIYTKTGDRGITGLLTGIRVRKSSKIIDLIGNIDEFSAHIGHAESISTTTSIKKYLTNILIDLYGINAALASLPIVDTDANTTDNQSKYSSIHERYALRENMDKDVEKAIDALTDLTPPLTKFILPVGSAQSTYLHICRTVCRRVERKMVKYYNFLNSANIATQELLDIIRYFNRLSDFLFVAARYSNQFSDCTEQEYTREKLALNKWGF